jgi:hypothetical protein
MSDFESSLQKWLLIFIVGIAITVASMNYWYKTLPERAARENANRAPTATIPASHPPLAAEAPASTAPAPPPNNTAAVESLQSREVDADIPHLTLADGRTLGFATTRKSAGYTEDWAVTDIIHPWVLVEETQEKVSLPVIPSQREAFTPIQLADGRLALIGGRTPRDIVALESKCADCPDEYIPFGEATPSTTTDVFDFEAGAWSKGPTADNTGTAAIRLRDGSVLKLGLVEVTSGERTETDIHLETADSAFTRWEKAGETRSDVRLNGARLFESRNGAVILLSQGGSQRAYHWTPRGKIKPWLEGESWIEVEQLDEGHLQLTQGTGDSQRSKKQIVELP